MAINPPYITPPAPPPTPKQHAQTQRVGRLVYTQDANGFWIAHRYDDDGNLIEIINEPFAPAEEKGPECECGAAKTYGLAHEPAHSSWCPWAKP